MIAGAEIFFIPKSPGCTSCSWIAPRPWQPDGWHGLADAFQTLPASPPFSLRSHTHTVMRKACEGLWTVFFQFSKYQKRLFTYLEEVRLSHMRLASLEERNIHSSPSLAPPSSLTTCFMALPTKPDPPFTNTLIGVVWLAWQSILKEARYKNTYWCISKIHTKQDTTTAILITSYSTSSERLIHTFGALISDGLQ